MSKGIRDGIHVCAQVHKRCINDLRKKKLKSVIGELPFPSPPQDNILSRNKLMCTNDEMACTFVHKLCTNDLHKKKVEKCNWGLLFPVEKEGGGKPDICVSSLPCQWNLGKSEEICGKYVGI